MKLESLSVVGLHGTLNHRIQFGPDLTLLVGINGSGKTTLLNVVDWILRSHFTKLWSLQFKQIDLTFFHHRKRHTLRATQDATELKLALVGSRKRAITVPGSLSSSESVAQSESQFDGLHLERHERPLWAFLQTLDRPVVITLDRTLSAEVDASTLFTDQPSPRAFRRNQPPLVPPIVKVKQVTAERYAKYTNQLSSLNDNLKASIITSAFRAPLHTRARAPNRRRDLSVQEIDRLEKKVTDFMSPSTLGQSNKTQISRYFQQARSFLKNAQDLERYREVFEINFQLIESLAEAFDEFDQESAKEYEAIRRYLEAVNRFLGDSSKELFFDPATNALSFRFRGRQLSRDLAQLSSGERQILVLLTFLAFVAKENSLFIVDEPELSLHPKWQLEFMEAFLSLRPSGAQLLIATHSPEIVSKHKADCVVLASQR